MKNCCLLVLSCLLSACHGDTLFTQQKDSGISFQNILTETDADNVMTYEYFYNGGGVGAGDFNNDGLIDLIFTGNQVANALYLNKGNLLFEDITQAARLPKPAGAWATGVSVVDINADGLLDIYICYSGLREKELRKNQLFINQGIKGGVPVFTEAAESYGLADSGYGTQAAFLDYDRDGDLDCFLINHNVSGYERKEAHVMRVSYDENAGDKLFRNDNGKFTEVTVAAGIKANPLGFGLGVSIADLNQDGLIDMYVANDFVEDDYLYINQGDGTFKDELRNYLEHTAYSSMGVDIADINNDLLPDILTTDMLPEANDRQKLLVWPDNWNVYQAQLQNGFWHANMRNMLQLNNGNGTFSEIGQLAGIANTDWSWSVVVQDFDLDRQKDIFISNGIGRDFTNIDFIKYSSENNRPNAVMLEELKKLTNSQTKNYIFKNNGNTTFSNFQKEWGFDNVTMSNGTVAVDLDNDGDLEIVTNNLNEPARVYKNNLQEKSPKGYVKLQLQGHGGNPHGIGAKVILRDKNGPQLAQVNPTKGYLSSSIDGLIFAAEPNATAEVFWPDGTYQKITPQLNQVTVIDQQAAGKPPAETKSSDTYYTQDTTVIRYQATVPYVNDFEQQLLLPQQYSYFGPKMQKADLNHDGLEDLIVAGNSLNPTAIFFGGKNGRLVKATTANFGKRNVQDIVVADFNGDQHPDLYFAIGDYRGYDPQFQNDELWYNNGKGEFLTKKDIPDGIYNKTAVAQDFNQDGTTDVFVGGFTKPLNYPLTQPSVVFLNKNNQAFTKTNVAFNGLITDAVAGAANEIIVVGEWMPPTLLRWENGNFSEIQNTFPPNLNGWWNCVQEGDLDGDGDADLVLGNIGRNVQFRASENQPVTLITNDFDNNGRVDSFMEYFIGETAYPPYSRDEVTEQVPALRKRFQTYADYANATLTDFFGKEALAKADKKQITEQETVILEKINDGYVVHQLPLEAQYSAVYAALIHDVNHDKKPDLVLVGNNSNLRLRLGKIDANFGQLFVNQGNFAFKYVPQWQSGLAVRGDARSIISLNNRLLIGVNKVPIYAYELSK